MISAGETLAHYRIEGPLGRGGMGEVYCAFDGQLERRVALKILPESLTQDAGRLRRFEREAKSLAALSHPNIVTVFSVDAAAPIPYMTMELVEGQALSRVIPEGGLTMDRFFELAVPMADALAAAHEKGIIHRDLKPANVMVDPQGRPKILDFGLAKILPGQPAAEEGTLAATATMETAAGVVLGTLGYMSPEQIRGDRTDERADIFSLGLVMYEMATGNRAFEAKTSPELMSALLRDTPASVEESRPDMPRHLARVIRHCLEKDPDRRYQSAKDVRNELEDLARELDTEAILKSDSVSDLAEPSGSLGHWGRILGAVGALVIGIVLAYLFVRRGVEGPPVEEAPKIQSLAVLPLDNLMNDADQDYFVEGMHEALITDLSKISALRVISRTSAMRYQQTEKTIPEIAEELDVDALVEGSVLRADGTVRITAQLIDGRTDRHLWAQSYDRQLQDVLVLLSEVAREIAREIEVTVTAEQEQRLASAPSVDPAVQELLLKGRYHFNSGRFDQFGRALEYQRQAVELDPTFAPAWAWLSGSYLIHGFFNLAPAEEMIPKALEAARRALDLDESQGLAHLVVGYVALFFDWNWATAQSELELAVDLAPTEVMAYHGLADYQMVLGDCDGSVDQVRRGRHYDPMGSWAHSFVTAHLTLCGRFEEAIEEGERSLALGIVDSPVRYYMGLSYWFLGEYEEALGVWRDHFGPDSTWLQSVESGYSASGPQGAMLALAEREESADPRRRNPYTVATFFAAAGDADGAFEWLNQAFEERTPQLLHLTFDPLLDPIRDDPRFAELLQRIGVPESAF